MIRRKQLGITLRAALLAIGMLAAPTAIPAAILILEDFDPSAAGWDDRDTGEMTVSHDAVNDRMVGSFDAQGFPVPQTDAFTIYTGTDFLGDYVTPGLTQISFYLFAANVLPSDLFINLIDGANTFSHQFNLGAMMLNVWTPFTVDLAWSAGWNGPSQSAFNTALTSVDQLDIQLTRNGTGAQSFYLDNVETLGNPPVEGGVVPEPAVALLFFQGVVVVIALRRRFFGVS